MEQIRQYDHVSLKDGRSGCIVEVLDQNHFIVDLGNSPDSWSTEEVARDQIEMAE